MRFHKIASPHGIRGKGKIEMATIQYFDGNEFHRLEVSDEFAELYNALENESKNILRRARSNQVSLEALMDAGMDFEANVLEENAWKESMLEKLPKSLCQLTQDQQWLVKQIFYLGRTKSAVANELGVSNSAISQRLDRIFKKMKKFLG